jgi:hypothetical protein
VDPVLLARYDDAAAGGPESNPLPALNSTSSFQSSSAWRASASGAACRVVAPEVSVLFVVVEAEGWRDAAAWGLPKEPPDCKDSAARESEVMVPGFSTLVDWVDVTCGEGC